MSVSLYDLLDVEENATAAEIRAAWKAAIADLDPTDRRFRAYNDAAGVLLDPEQRAAYDLELAASRGADEDVDGDVDEDDDEEAVEAAAEPVPAAEADADVEPEPDPEPEPESRPEAATERTGPPVWSLYVAGFVAALAAALLIVVLTWPGTLGSDSVGAQDEQAQDAENAGKLAEDAAQAAVPVVLGYDYRTFDADIAEATDYLTEDFAAQRADLLDELRKDVTEQKLVVDAAVVTSGLTRVADDGNQATVVVFVNQDSSRGTAAPRSLRMWASLTMVNEGDDWLIDDICIEQDCE